MYILFMFLKQPFFVSVHILIGLCGCADLNFFLYGSRILLHKIDLFIVMISIVGLDHLQSFCSIAEFIHSA